MLVEVSVQDKKGLSEIEEDGKELTAEQKEQIERAEDILRIVQAHICRKNIFFHVFTNILRRVPVEEDILLETDGIHLFYQPQRLITEAEKRRLPKVEERLLHILCHGILGHFSMRGQAEEKQLADPAMDYEVDRLGERLEWRKASEREEETRRSKTAAAAMECLKGMGARQIYHFSRFHGAGRRFLENYAADGSEGDDHEVWERRKQYHWLLEFPEELSDEEGTDAAGRRVEQEWEQARMTVFGSSAEDGRMEQRLQEGQKGRKAGRDAGLESKRVKAAAGQGRSYREVLEDVFRERERFQEREDTIDRMLYMYGFEQYGDIALIEPEECCEVKTLHTVVIAIDTSGSCSGSVMEIFLRETRKILRDISTETSFEQIFVLQCDTVIQQENIYKEPDEIPTGIFFQVKGFGGTDFRPVFQRIAELEKKQGIIPDCLLYLTDGEGFFPDKAPDYPTFLILPGRCPDDLPAWTQKIYLKQRG